MSYIPVATDPDEPTDSEKATTAALEFRTLKAYIQSVILAAIAAKLPLTGGTLTGPLGIGAASGGARIEIHTGTGAFNAVNARFNAANAPLGFGVANSNGFAYLASNTKQISGTDAQTYDITNFATRVRMDGGQFIFERAISGTAGSAITWIEAARIDTAGKLGIGVNAPAYRLDVDNGGTNGAKLFKFGGAGLISLYGYADSAGSGITNSDPRTSGALYYLAGTVAQIFAVGGLSLNGSAVTSVGGNISVFDIQGLANARGGAINLKTLDNSQSCYYYLADGTAVLGTRSNHPLVLTTGDTGRVTLDTSGNFTPVLNNVYSSGASGLRWSTVYGVAGNYSGTVTAANFVGSGAGLTGIAVSISGADVIAALGYTPYNSANPTGYITTAGNAATAAALQTPRTINGVSFDGTAAITVPAAAGTLTGATLAAGITASSLTSVGDLVATSTIAGAVIGTRDLPPASVTTGAFIAADAGKCVFASGPVTVPNTIMSAGNVVILQDETGSAQTITASIATLRKTGTTLTGNRTLLPYGRAAIIFKSGTLAYISGDIT